MKKKKGKKGKYTKAKKIVLGILIGYVALMVLGYIAGVVYFTKHFYLGSQINGMNASGKSVEDVEDSIVDEIASYTLKLKERDGKTESIVASQINMQYVDDGKIQELKDKQNPFLPDLERRRGCWEREPWRWMNSWGWGFWNGLRIRNQRRLFVSLG